MSRTLQFKRYANTIVATTTGADGELIVDETNHTITVHDGVTVGGTRIATEKFVNNVSNTITNITSNTYIKQTANANVNVLVANSAIVGGNTVATFATSGNNVVGLVGANSVTYPIASTYTWAQLQALTGVIAGTRAYVSDLNYAEFVYNGTTWVTGKPLQMMQTAIPMILQSSGSVSAGGLVTGLTALPYSTFPQPAYMYFPANKLAASQTAGFFYVSITSTTTATAYLNQLSASSLSLSVPQVPSTLIPVTAGQGAYTQTTGADIPTLQIPVPAGLMGTQGGFYWDIQMDATNNANAKNAKLWLGATFGGASQLSGNLGVTGVSGGNYSGRIRNTGSASIQVGGVNGSAGFGTSSLPSIFGAVNTANLSYLYISLNTAVATDNFIITQQSLVFSS
jgi:hypothetical protein